MRTPVEPRFWVKVDMSGDGCWEWTASRTTAGYGQINVNGLPIPAHRVSWQLTHGPIPDGLHVCHRCDNRPCVRPDHLFLGTHLDNMRDMVAKGRGSAPPLHCGAEHPNATLTDEQIREARESYASGREFQYQIAARLGVAQTTVGAWIRGDVRRDAGGPFMPRRPRRSKRVAA